MAGMPGWPLPGLLLKVSCHGATAVRSSGFGYAVVRLAMGTQSTEDALTSEVRAPSVWPCALEEVRHVNLMRRLLFGVVVVAQHRGWDLRYMQWV